MIFNINYDNKNVEVSINKITQFLGIDFSTKHFVVNSICKYFSASKYSVYEENMIDNILVEDEKIGRESFEVIKISNRDDLLQKFSMTKNSLFINYINEFSLSSKENDNLNNIDLSLINIFNDINEEINKKLNNIKVDYTLENIINIVSKSEVLTADDKNINFISNYDLVYNFIMLIYELYKKRTKSMIIIFEDIDHILTFSKYKKIVETIINLDVKNINFIFNISIDDYVYVDKNYIENITVFNEEIINVPIYERIKNYIYETYPYQINLDDENLNEILKHIISKFGKKINQYEINNIIFRKLFNKAMCVNDDKINKINDSEISFLIS